MLIAVATLLLTIGFPRIYGTEIPLFVILAPFFYKDYFEFYKNNKKISHLFFTFLIAFCTVGTLQYLLKRSDWVDFFFHFVICSKIFLSFLGALVVSKYIKTNPTSLTSWIVIQYLLIILSSFNRPIYDFLIQFLSPKTADIFTHVYYLRTVGFGLYHTDGIFLLVSLVLVNLYIKKSDKLSLALFMLLIPLSITMARTAILIILSFVFLKLNKKIWLSFLLGVTLVVAIKNTVPSGPFRESTELISKNINDINTVVALKNMKSIPDNVLTFLMGDGKYFGPPNQYSAITFYQNTDKGFSRMLFYSGVFYLILFAFINLIFTLCSFDKNKSFFSYIKNNTLNIVVVLTFFIMNYKGIQTILFISLISYLLISKYFADKNLKEI